MIYKIIEATPKSLSGVEFRGAAKAFWKSKAHEIMISGPAESGKTFSALHKLDALCWHYSGVQAAIVRKVQNSLYGTVCQTYQNKVANMKVINSYGGDKTPDRYEYPNGSVIWLGGMDNPDKVLSGERDFIYVNQAEELKLNDWEILVTRATGRAGNAPYSQIMGDCNPGGSKHWILERKKAGSLVMLESVHQDNPNLYDAEGNITEQGKITIEILDGLTGIRYKRLRLGQWVTAEGAVYDMFDKSIHVVHRDITEFQRFGLAMDEGYTHPAVILLIGIDGDGRLHILREFYKRGVLQSDVVLHAKSWFLEFSYKFDICAVDAAAAGLIADLMDAGVPAEPAKGRVLDGINQVQNYLKVQPDGKPRLTMEPEVVETINEFESYIWKPEKDEPIKENDHAMDAIRYFIDARGKGKWWLA